MKAKSFFAGIFFFVFLLAAVAQSQAQAQVQPATVQLTEEQQNQLIVGSAKKIKELKDKVEAGGTGLTRGDVQGMIKKGTVELNGPARNALKKGVADNWKGIEGLRKHTEEIQGRQSNILVAQIIVAKGIQNPTAEQIAAARALAERVQKATNPDEQVKELVKALAPAGNGGVDALQKAFEAVNKATLATLKGVSGDIASAKDDARAAKVEASKASRDALDAKKVADDALSSAGHAKADALMAKQIANDVKAAADGAKEIAEGVANQMNNLQGDVQQTKSLAKVTARTVAKVVKEDEKLLVDYFFNLSEAGISLSNIGLTLADVQSRGLFGKEPDTIQEFTKFLTGKFKDPGLTSEDAQRMAEDLTAGMNTGNEDRQKKN